MAFGFPAYHEADVTLPMPATHEWIAFACHAAGFAPPHYQQLGASVGWRTSVTVSLWSWGERIAITWLAPQVIRVRSECALPTQCIDWGRNATNVDRFASTILGAMAQAMGASGPARY